MLLRTAVAGNASLMLLFLHLNKSPCKRNCTSGTTWQGVMIDHQSVSVVFVECEQFSFLKKITKGFQDGSDLVFNCSMSTAK